MGPTWVLSAPDGPHVGPMNLAMRVYTHEKIIHLPDPDGTVVQVLTWKKEQIYHIEAETF